MKKIALTITDTSIVARRGTSLSMLPPLRVVAKRLNLEFVDARWRRWDCGFMILAAITFVLSGNFFLLLFALLCGSDWARSFPREN